MSWKLPFRRSEPADPTVFRPLTRKDLGVERFNRGIVIGVGVLAGVILLAAITVLSSYQAPRETPRHMPPVGASTSEPEPWLELPSRALPHLQDPTPQPKTHVPPPPALPERKSHLGREDRWALRRQEILEKAMASLPYPEGAPRAWRGLTQPDSTDEPPPTPTSVRAVETLQALLRGPELLGGPTLESLDERGVEGKREFLRRARRDRKQPDFPLVLERPNSPYLVSEGSVIPCVLEGGIHSDLPGPLRARVREPIYDTPTGRFLLIPQGTLLTGTYDSAISHGQSRVLVVANRLIFPDASSLRLRGMPLIDPEGFTGLRDRVNHHLLRTFGSAILMAAISGGAQISQGGHEARTDRDSESVRETLAAALGQQLSQVSSELVGRNLQVPPTIEIRPGTLFHVHVLQDLILPGPYEPRYLAAPERG